MKKLNYNSVFQIDNRFVGLDKPAYFIADIAANHDGSFEEQKNNLGSKRSGRKWKISITFQQKQ